MKKNTDPYDVKKLKCLLYCFMGVSEKFVKIRNLLMFTDFRTKKNCNLKAEIEFILKFLKLSYTKLSFLYKVIIYSGLYRASPVRRSFLKSALRCRRNQ